MISPWPALLGAVVAGMVMTAWMSASRLLGLSRMSLPFVLGTMFTANRDRAQTIGLVAHLMAAYPFAVLYWGIFSLVDHASWWLGALLGLGHGLFTFLVILPVLPGIHPRMASERDGPQPTRSLEPPGLLGLNYGKRTPIVGIAAHVIFGFVFGLVCQLGS